MFEKWEALLPKVNMESALITSVIDTHEEHSVAVYSITGAFLPAKQCTSR
jgi:hypothetical protein